MIDIEYNDENCHHIDTFTIEDLGHLNAEIINVTPDEGFVPLSVTLTDGTNFEDDNGESGATYTWTFYKFETEEAVVDMSTEENLIEYESLISEVEFEENLVTEVSGKEDEHINPDVKFTEPGFYVPYLEVKSKKKCTSTFAFDGSIKVEANIVVEMPNIFSPNGSEENKIFKPFLDGKEEAVASFECKIFNRWGKEIYTWSKVEEGWDGKIGGTVAASGTYYYVVTTKDKAGKNYDDKGSLYLVNEE